MAVVNSSVPKIDSMALTLGRPVYTDDLAPENCLIVKVLHSPHAHALIKGFDLRAARKVDGVVCILTHEDMPKIRFTMAGESFPEPSGYDRYVLEDRVRYVGDPVAIVAGVTEKAVDKALAKIKVKYEVLTPVLDFEQALDNPVVVHPEEDLFHQFPVGHDIARNLAASESYVQGDETAAFAKCDVILEDTFYTKAVSQCPMETFRTYSYLDYESRLTLVTSTQVPFHVRRMVAQAFGLPQTRVRVIKPRIGGGFGAKQSMNTQMLCCAVTLHTGRPAKLIYTRQESFTASHSRHEMRVKVKLGATRDGIIRAAHMEVLSNAGAYGDHAGTTVGLVGHKTLPLCGKAESYYFDAKVVYTNTMTAGAYRGFGATQGTFAMESMMGRMAKELGMDLAQMRLLNIPEENDPMPSYLDGPASSIALDRCITTGRKMIGWDEKTASVRVDDHTVRGLGMAVTMQGSLIAGFDQASATVHLNDKGFYTLEIGATDMGTGCDTILAQIAADTLMCGMDRITVHGVDTDTSPYDTGSYASSTTFNSGKAVMKACQGLVEKMKEEAAFRLESRRENIAFDGNAFSRIDDPDKTIDLETIAVDSVWGRGEWLTATASNFCKTSPPPFMATFAEVEIDEETGKITVKDCVGVVDCGTVINPALATVQAEGGVVQGIGMALYEDIRYNHSGKMINDSYMQYKIPSRLDVPPIRIAFESSYEKLGPYGAKSIGEVVINGAAPAINNAILAATGISFSKLPILPENMLEELMRRG